MSILTPGERPSVWSMIGDLVRRVARLEAVPPGSSGTSLKIVGTAVGGPTIDPAVELRIANDDSVFPSGFTLVNLGAGVAELFNDSPQFDTPNGPTPDEAGHYWQTRIQNAPTFSLLRQEEDYEIFEVLGSSGDVAIQLDPDNSYSGVSGIVFSVAGAGQAFVFTLPVGGTFSILDSGSNPMLQMTAGSPDLHIPVGGTVVADL